MKVINIHHRTLSQPKAEVLELFQTLSSKNDRMLATDKWPPMRLDQGLAVGSKGGHGPIRYTVQAYNPEEFIEFRFSKPKGFHGTHKFEITALANNSTELKHTIEMEITGMALISWPLAIRCLHDAFIEDAFDKVENQFNAVQKHSPWSIWVWVLRWMLK